MHVAYGIGMHAKNQSKKEVESILRIIVVFSYVSFVVFANSTYFLRVTLSSTFDLFCPIFILSLSLVLLASLIAGMKMFLQKID